MNLADSMRSQDNLNKVVFTEKRNIKYDGENIIYCLWIEWQIFPFADKISKLPEKKRKYVSSDNQPYEEDIHISAWDLKRQYKVCNFGLKAEIRRSLKRMGRSAGLSSEGRDLLVTQADLSAPHVCFLAVAQLHKKGPCHRRKICANSLRLYSYYIQSSPSKNKNINYIFIYLRCLFSGAIYYGYIYSKYLWFLLLLLVDILIHIDSTLLRIWAVLQRSSFFYISYRLTLPGILIICLSVSFLIIPSAPTITGTVGVLMCHIFSISISRFLHLLILLYSLVNMLSVATDTRIIK